MAKKSIVMRQVTEILRLKCKHQLSIREIARSCHLAPSTVGDYLQRAEAAGLTWAEANVLSDIELEQRLMAPIPAPALAAPTAVESKAPPDWKYIQNELRRPNVTLRLLWQESQRADPSGLKYSRYCELYRAWSQTLDPTLRQTHLPGEKLFVDWAGQTVPIYSSADGTTTDASVFVAALGASSKTFAQAYPDEKLPSWISAHVAAYVFYDGVPALTVPDNPKTGVIKACRYEPILHRTYQEMAEHHGTVIVPARPAKPRDKELVSYYTRYS